MKKKLLFLFATIMLSVATACATECTSILDAWWFSTGSGTYKVKVKYRNESGYNQSLRVTLYNTSGGICFSDCAIALYAGERTYTSLQFSCSAPAVIGVQVYQNTTCGGAACYNTLPVSLVEFNAVPKNTSIDLSWKTANEQNVSGFLVQRSLDNSIWSDIAFIKTSAVGGSSTLPLSYSYSDISFPNERWIYYRLRQEDIDGKQNQSKVILVRRVVSTPRGGSLVSVFPNPIKGGSLVTLRSDAKIFTAELSSADGAPVLTLTVGATNQLQVPKVSTGLYWLRFFSKDQKPLGVTRIIIQK